MSVQIPSPFENFIYSLLFSCKSSWYILDISSLLAIWFANFQTNFLVLTFFFKPHNFNFGCILPFYFDLKSKTPLPNPNKGLFLCRLLRLLYFQLLTFEPTWSYLLYLQTRLSGSPVCFSYSICLETVVQRPLTTEVSVFNWTYHTLLIIVVLC